MSNPLTEIVPGTWRKVGYAVLFVVGVAIGGTFAGFAAVGADAPNWLLFASAFYGVITGPAWSLPFSNVESKKL